MPNYCDFEVKLTGKFEDILRFYNACTKPYECKDTDPEHFYRVFACDLVEIVPTNVLPGIFEGYFTGYCAWSVLTCFRDQGYHKTDNMPNALTLERLSKECPDLVIEMFSTEPGMQFSEHLLLVDSEFIIDECDDYYELYSGIELDEFNSITGLNWTQQEFNRYFMLNEYYCNITSFDYSNHIQLLERK